ncbi:CDP-alcohol phosphatidyltransferase family protein [Oryzihumus sp.]|uniref:CDP-alcohol phosphatidyltransferase family protein n=1 Tax=Oryzihumus sp. TaxID=1968903 RepID=UPI002ED9643E
MEEPVDLAHSQRPVVVVSDRVFTLPNVLSMLRLVGVPLFLWLILTGHDGWALTVLALSGVSDYLDGKIARRFGLISRVGQLLDPLADRLYILSTLLGLAWREIIPWWLVAVLVAREVLGTVLLLVVRRQGVIGLPVHFVGKAATFNLLYAFPLLLLGEGSSAFAAVARPVGWAFAWWGVALYWVAGIMYAVQVRDLLRSLRQARA